MAAILLLMALYFSHRWRFALIVFVFLWWRLWALKRADLRMPDR